ncbi:MAG: 4-(cytidine 5'-diphospho)-2-C-methyl-D-erythritol kinase [Bacteroidota bacterium]
MIVRPNCKINLGLNVVRKRIDGYHDIETVFYPASLSDIVEIQPSQDGNFHFSSSGLKIPGDSSSNLCVQAYNLMNEHFGIPPVTIRLEKIIPTGSGLGGGSSDGAFTLKALNEIFRLSLSNDQLKAFASRLGSDCTFFIDNRPAFAQGRGEKLEAVPISLKGTFLIIVIPHVHISTSEAYAMINPEKPSISLREIVKTPVSEWKSKMVNDFEKPVINKFPLIGKIKDLLYDKGALYASMSGSGSSVYGLFKEIPAVEGLFPGCFVWLSPTHNPELPTPNP